MMSNFWWIANKTIVVLLVLLYLMPVQIAYSQEETYVECGQVLDAKFTQNAEEYLYLIDMVPRENLEVSVRAAGDFLQSVVVLYGPTGLDLTANIEPVRYDSGYYYTFYGVAESPSVSSGILSATGAYTIRIANTGIFGPMEHSDSKFPAPNHSVITHKPRMNENGASSDAAFVEARRI